jgi:hypothetical protein
MLTRNEKIPKEFEDIVFDFKFIHRVNNSYVKSFYSNNDQLYYTNIEYIGNGLFSAHTNFCFYYFDTNKKSKLPKTVFNIIKDINIGSLDISFKGDIFVLYEHLSLLFPIEGRNYKLKQLGI